jgi:hypothetical protein
MPLPSGTGARAGAEYNQPGNGGMCGTELSLRAGTAKLAT